MTGDNVSSMLILFWYVPIVGQIKAYFIVFLCYILNATNKLVVMLIQGKQVSRQSAHNVYLVK